MATEEDNLTLLLRSLGRFSDEAMDAGLERFSRVEAKKNQILLGAGDVCTKFYFVNAGCIRTYFQADGSEKTRLILPSFSIGTALASFIGQRPSFECIDCLEDAQLLAIGRTDFYHLVNEFAEWARFYQTILEMAYTFQNTKIEHLVTLTAAQRYETLWKENPTLLQRVPARIIASYLDMAPETLSRLRAART